MKRLLILVILLVGCRSAPSTPSTPSTPTNFHGKVVAVAMSTTSCTRAIAVQTEYRTLTIIVVGKDNLQEKKTTIVFSTVRSLQDLLGKQVWIIGYWRDNHYIAELIKELNPPL